MNKEQTNQPRNGLERGPHFRGPVVKPKNQKQTLKRIWDYVKQQRLQLIGAIFLVILTTVLSLAGPLLIGVIVDDYIITKDLSGTTKMLFILAGVYVLTSIFTWLQTYVMINAALKTIQKLRLDLFEKLHSLSLRFFDKRSQGDLMSRVTNDIDNLNVALSQSVVQIVSSILTLIGTSIAMFILSWQLAIVTLTIIPLIVFVSKQIIKKSSVNYSERQRDLGALNGYIEETITGSEVITLFGQEKMTTTHFAKVNESLRTSAMKAEITSGFLGPINNFMNNLGLGLVIGTGALMAVSGHTSIGVIAAFVTYTRQFFRPINQLSNLLNTFQSAIAGAERVFEIMDEKPERTDGQNAIVKEQLKGDVSFRDVTFSYDTGKPVLKNISFQAKAGETIALVGPTGSGKTTIINLLTRFYDIDQGEILLDNEDIRSYKIANVREKVGVVLQDTYLFSGTIMDNIRYGRLDASDDEVIQAAKVAYAHSFIKYLPDQYQTEIKSGGVNLSQGQRQLLAIARAILEDADILILDEATSSVDTRTEVQIQKGLKHLMTGRTSFVIAHRLKTIENADKILVIRDGEIIERGNHKELIEQQGFYSELQRKLDILPISS
ncbi:multidrug ABC transporter ATP-binding protein [Viridibacillus sp. FSL H8-0123]|uniref:ABC transporter ATP-binding protein n=1 Tax=Viridibacillus arenosi FSL R5-213 TaxID=1227360 RepID=W4EXH1_9BACL|nr:ABC transporter ATP-binding protein [Viridibacillus arenosi FSL R5-213]OMC81006.1 multidrug ABC transporter ATP-binding protein [Viridibacillus sp. FSL H8-0123]OMC86560.1 multidrug ABC transporter ATP-binding protein [Viridibacillus sp. FSL H7-0596]OMC89336.1 multidrug ABC transporter ATP-binding protein [Viridibacillus arenosi]